MSSILMRKFCLLSKQQYMPMCLLTSLARVPLGRHFPATLTGALQCGSYSVLLHSAVCAGQCYQQRRVACRLATLA